MPNRGHRFVLPLLWKCRDLVERLIGAGVEVSRVSRNCQVLTTGSVNNQVGAGGACAIALMVSSAAPIGGRPTAQFSIADIADATRSCSHQQDCRARKKLDCQCHLRPAAPVPPSAAIMVARSGNNQKSLPRVCGTSLSARPGHSHG
jgi:hypothetical protein